MLGDPVGPLDDLVVIVAAGTGGHVGLDFVIGDAHFILIGLAFKKTAWTLDGEFGGDITQVERHADETGWVAPLTQEDKDHFAYLRKVFKRYNIAPSKATPTEYDFVVRVAESEFYSR